GVARVQVELADLRGRHVDVIGARQVVVVGRTQEAEAVGQRLEHTLGEDVAALLGAHAQDFEDDLLLAHAGRAGDVEVLGNLRERGDAHFLHRRERDRLRGSLRLRWRGRRRGRRRGSRGGGGRRGAGGFVRRNGGGYATVRFGRLAIIFHSSSSP